MYAKVGWKTTLYELVCIIPTQCIKFNAMEIISNVNKKNGGD